MYTTVLFDLDGTITNPMKSFKRCLSYVLHSLGLEMPKGNELLKWVGPPINESFKNFLGLDDEKATYALKLYREFYASEGGLNGNEMYEGIKPMLKSLKASGLTLAVATCKLEEFANTIIKENGLGEYFSAVFGALKSSRTQKWEIIQQTLTALNVTDKSKVIMVGDRFHDIEGAKTCGLDTIGVLWGYGSRQELISHGAILLAEKPSDLVKILTGKEK